MIVNASLNRKDPEALTERCDILDAVELSPEEFSYFKTHLMDNYDFLDAFNDSCQPRQDSALDCLLVLCRDSQDGILVDTEGSSYARYSSYLPGARNLWNQIRYPEMFSICEQLVRSAEIKLQSALIYQHKGRYHECLPHKSEDELIPERTELLRQMLRKHVEVEDAYEDFGQLTIVLKPQYSSEPNFTMLQKPSETAIRQMLAKHLLWLSRNPAGEQADFSNCLLREVDLSGADLANAKLDGAVFLDCCLTDAVLTQASCVGTTFQNCYLYNAIVTDADLTDAKIIGCDCSKAQVVDSCLTGVIVRGSSLHHATVDGCCIDHIDIKDVPTQELNANDNIDDEVQWRSEQDQTMG